MQKNIQPGSIIETTITRIGKEGDGVGEWQDMAVIVPKTAPGDLLTCIVKYTTANRIHADLSGIITEGNSRIKAPCEYYASCGGCGLQHINNDEYKNYKIGLLTSALSQGGIPLPADIGWVSVGQNSRRRAFLRFNKNGNFGFYEHQSHNVINIQKCLILEPELEALLPHLKELSLKLNIDIEGWMVTNTDTGIDLIMQTTDKYSKAEGMIFGALAKFAKTYIPLSKEKIARISWKRDSKIFPVTVTEKPALSLNNMEIILPQEYFLQASKNGQEAILNAVIPHVEDGAKLLDLFSGVGIYSFALANKASRVGAYEIAQEMIDSMEVNIRAHKLGDKISAYCRDIDAYPLEHNEISKYDTAIINPPRTGALKQITTLALARMPKIIIVSCNSGTFARDAKVLFEHGYRLKSLDAIDQFYYSHHLEQVGVFIL